MQEALGIEGVASIDDDLIRLRSEFVQFPGMCFTREQVARLLDVRHGEAAVLLAMLESEGLLFHLKNNVYRRKLPLLT